MTAQPGLLQATFSAAEIGPRFNQRPELKYFKAGMAHARNVEIFPQGGFSVAPGLRYVGPTAIDAARLIPFKANDGSVYDLAWTGTTIEVWGKTAKLHAFAHGYNAGQVAQLLWAQQLDTLLTFHVDRAPQRYLHASATSWVAGDAPLADIPTYDYGAVYSNGVAAEWTLDFIGFGANYPPLVPDTAFIVTVNGEDTTALRPSETVAGSNVIDMVGTAAKIQTAILALPNVGAGATCVMVSNNNPYQAKIVFGGASNLSDDWVVSVRVVNDASAVVTATKTVVGVKPGEPVISTARGWPRCGVFYQQRLLMGGFKSLPNAWIASITGRYFDFDQRLKSADGSFLVLLDIVGGEAVEAIVNNQFLLIMTSERNYWIAGSTQGLKKTEPPKHVPATDHGSAGHVPVADNEGAAIYVHKSGDFIGEMRYTDIDGNYVAQDLSLLGYPLVAQVRDLTVKRKEGGQSSNVAAIVNGDGAARLVYLLREQELTGFVREETDGSFLAIQANGRNELTAIVERPVAGSKRRSIERFEPGLLLHAALSFDFASPRAEVGGLQVHEGSEVWAIADDDVFGPYCVRNGKITLPKCACAVTVGRWTPPLITTLPLPALVAENVWVQKKRRIHTVQLFVENTTSLALAANGGKVRDVPLRRFGDLSGVPELKHGYTGLVTVEGLTGFTDAPQVTITQVRPGRLTVASIIVEATG